MRERAALLGGALNVESSPGAGTTLFVRIPFGAGGVEGEGRAWIRLRVFLADDHMVVREGLKSLVNAQAGHARRRRGRERRRGVAHGVRDSSRTWW